MRYKIMGYLFISLWMSNWQAKADITDTLSVDIEEKSWPGGIDLSIQTDSSIVSSISSGTDNVQRVTVYDIFGHIIRSNIPYSQALKELPKGVYIVNRRKYLVR